MNEIKIDRESNFGKIVKEKSVEQTLEYNFAQPKVTGLEEVYKPIVIKKVRLFNVQVKKPIKEMVDKPLTPCFYEKITISSTSFTLEKNSLDFNY